MPPNVVLIVMDTARVDAFEPWGAAAGSTPTVAQLARTGQCFTDVRSTANWTVPGHASMFGGALPRRLGLSKVELAPRACEPAILAASWRWLPEVLRANGYATGGITANLWVSAHMGFDIGFDRFETVVAPRGAGIHDPGWRARLGWAREGARGKTDDGAGRAEELLTSWVAEAGGQPFFWFVNLTECHSPYLPPRPYNDLPLLQRIRAADDARRTLTLESMWKTSLGLQQVPQEVLDRMRHLYDRSVQSMDDWLARFLDRLGARQLLDDTIVIVTSDHGENFGECGLIGHCFSLDDRLLRVPLVVSRPGFATDLVSLEQLPGAIADAIGLDDHPWPSPAGGVAVAHMDTVLNEEQLDSLREPWELDARSEQALTASTLCAVEGSLKLSRRDDGHEELFDLDDDPLETRPATLGLRPPTDVAEEVTRLRLALDRAEEDVPDVDFAPPAVVADAAESALVERKMRELGYI
jgi:arylsulfatase A-like enzyme